MNEQTTDRTQTHCAISPMLNLATNEWTPTKQNHCEFFGNRNITQIQIKWKEINLNRSEKKEERNKQQTNKQMVPKRKKKYEIRIWLKGIWLICAKIDPFDGTNILKLSQCTTWNYIKTFHGFVCMWEKSTKANWWKILFAGVKVLVLFSHFILFYLLWCASLWTVYLFVF